MFKIFTAAAALQEKVVDPDEIIDCGGGGIEIGGTRINDHHVFDDLSFRDVIAKSSDIGVIRVAQRLGRENFYRYMRDFGFGAPTGVDLPGESSGLLRPTNKWSALSLASLSFGQEIGVTALQMATAVAAVANGGYLMRPLIVRQIEDGEGRVVKECQARGGAAGARAGHDRHAHRPADARSSRAAPAGARPSRATWWPARPARRRSSTPRAATP